MTADLLPFLSRERGISLKQIENELAGRYAVDTIHQAVRSLADRGYVVSSEHSLDPRRAAFWSALGVSPRWVEETLGATSVSVIGDKADFGITAKLNEAGITIDPSNARLSVVVCDDYLAASLAEVNKSQIAARKPWLIVRPRGIQALFGPVFQAESEKACWTCLRDRLRNHNDVHSFLRHVAGDHDALKPFASERSMLDAVVGLIALEIVKWVVFDRATALNEHVIAVDARTLETSKHRVVRRPQCPTCGEQTLYQPDRPPTPVVLNASPKTFHNSGGTRSVPPQVTLAKYRDAVSPISGVVTWLTPTTDESDDWLHVHWAGSNLAMRNQSLSSLRRSLRSKSAGKGSTFEQSEVSALCEAIERYSGALHGEEIRTQGSLLDLGDDAIDPNDVQLFSEAQLANAASINALGHPYNVVPGRFDPKAKVDWTPVWSLSQQRHRYLPTSMLYSMPIEQKGAASLFADSNGCAAGNTMEEAILQGFYELVERDAFAIWWYNRLQVPEVDLSSFDDEFLATASSYYAKYGREIWVLDVTADICIPSFVALSRQPDGPYESIIYGAGAHANPRIAAQRAICELNQCLTWLPRPDSPNDGRPVIDDPTALRWWQTATLEKCGWLSADPDSTPHRFADYAKIELDDLREDVEYCRSLVESLGMEFLVLDQTRPDVGMPVARVIVPGMRHFWARFAPGRLYDVPVKLGYHNNPISEDELNPEPVIA